MKNQLINKAGETRNHLRFFIFIILFSSFCSAQTKTNLDIFYNLVDSAAAAAAEEVAENYSELSISTELGIYYRIFENPIISKFTSKEIKVIRNSNSDSSISHLNFVIDEAVVKYGEQERDGFLGDFFVSRDVKISGNYLLTNTGNSIQSELKNFTYSYNDKVRADSIDRVENRSYPFTQGELPTEPFFSSLLEPVIAVGAAAVAVILFFSVRSK